MTSGQEHGHMPFSTASRCPTHFDITADSSRICRHRNFQLMCSACSYHCLCSNRRLLYKLTVAWLMACETAWIVLSCSATRHHILHTFSDPNKAYIPCMMMFSSFFRESGHAPCLKLTIAHSYAFSLGSHTKCS